MIGFIPEIWKSLEQVLNFTTVFVPNVDGKWGGYDENGDWNGLLGMVDRNEIDTTLVDMTLSKARAEYFGHTSAIHTDT